MWEDERRVFCNRGEAEDVQHFLYRECFQGEETQEDWELEKWISEGKRGIEDALLLGKSVGARCEQGSNGHDSICSVSAGTRGTFPIEGIANEPPDSACLQCTAAPSQVTY